MTGRTWPPSSGHYARAQVSPTTLARINLLSTLAEVGARHDQLAELLRYQPIGSPAVELAFTVDRLAQLADELYGACLDAGCRPTAVWSHWHPSLGPRPGDDGDDVTL